MPLTAEDIPSGVFEAIADGRAFSPHWWKASVTSSSPLLHLAMIGQVSGEAYYLSKILVAFAVPLLLSPINLWPKFYAGACLLLAMYCMVSEAWVYPHIGFLTLLYLVWAFWTLPPLQQ